MKSQSPLPSLDHAIRLFDVMVQESRRVDCELSRRVILIAALKLADLTLAQHQPTNRHRRRAA